MLLIHSLTLLLMDFGRQMLNYLPVSIWRLIFFIGDVLNFWITKALLLVRNSPTRRLKRELDQCKTYEEYKTVAIQLDKLNGYDEWRQNFASKKYDYKLIHERLMDLRKARKKGDYKHVVSLLRSGLLRNYGGIAGKRLYDKSYIGTKILIEEYVREVIECLHFISDMGLPDNTLELAIFYQEKLDFFHEARQTIGTTALILQGGTFFGLCHLGVIKALYARDLLPTVIAGSSVGAAVGALVCSLRPADLENHLNNLIDLLDGKDGDGDWSTNLKENVFRRGFSHDILLFIEYLERLLGNLTFEEAYMRSRRVLSIVVYPTESCFPNLLNYLSTPNMTVMSAVYCSLGYNALKKDVQPYIKVEGDEGSKIVRYQVLDRKCRFMSPYHARTVNGSGKNNESSFGSPYTRLTELFNVNHYVVSWARPYLAPLIGVDLRHSETRLHLMKKFQRIVNMELRYRVRMLDQLGLLFSFLKWSISDGTSSLYEGNQVLVVPQMRTMFQDFRRIFDVDNQRENIPYWIFVGERSVWPLYPLLQTRCGIEFTLDDFNDMYKGGSKSGTGYLKNNLAAPSLSNK